MTTIRQFPVTGLKTLACATALLSVAFLSRPADAAPPREVGVGHQLVTAEKLPNVPGKDFTAVEVDFAPGATAPAHHHSGFVFAYVLSGAVRSQLAGGPAQVYRTGDHFVEAPGSHHEIAANASKTKPARMLVVFVARDGAALTAGDR